VHGAPVLRLGLGRAARRAAAGDRDDRRLPEPPRGHRAEGRPGADPARRLQARQPRTRRCRRS
jgi:hypothetical protein